MKPVALALVVALLAALAGLVYAGSTACPPPAWAFWRYGPGGNFACVA